MWFQLFYVTSTVNEFAHIKDDKDTNLHFNTIIVKWICFSFFAIFCMYKAIDSILRMFLGQGFV